MYQSIIFRHGENAQAALEEAITAAPSLEACRLRQGSKTEACITVRPSAETGKQDVGVNHYVAI